MSSRTCSVCDSPLSAAAVLCPNGHYNPLQAPASEGRPPAPPPPPMQSSAAPAHDRVFTLKQNLGIGCVAIVVVPLITLALETYVRLPEGAIAAPFGIGLFLLLTSALLWRRASGPGEQIFRLLVTAFGIFSLVLALTRGTGQNPDAAVAGVSAALNVLAVYEAVAVFRSRRPSWRQALIVFAVTAVLGVAFAPPITRVIQRHREAAAWQRLSDGRTTPSIDEYENTIPEAFRRSELNDLKVEVHAKELYRHATGGRQRRDASSLRAIVKETEGLSKTDARFQPAYSEARTGVEEAFREALAKLEMNADPKLRRAFQTVLRELQQKNDGTIYLALVIATDIDPARKVVRQVIDGKTEEVVQPGDAVSTSANDARKKVFLDQMTSAFSNVFPQGLLVLKPLGPNDTQDGKIIFTARAHTSLSDQIFSLRKGPVGSSLNDGALLALLNGIIIDWQFTVVDNGQILYRDRARSDPAQQIDVPPDTDGARAYQYLIDSAYENYAKGIIEKFGVKPSP